MTAALPGLLAWMLRVAVLMGLGVAGYGVHAQTAADADLQPLVQSWMTTADGKLRLARMPDRRFTKAGPRGVVLRVDAETRFQTMVGFGASITESSAWLMQNRLDPAARTRLLQELFGHDGLNLQMTRLPIGASDFSRSHYSLNDRKAVGVDPSEGDFSIEANRQDILPVMKEIMAINPALQVVASPWSAPGWMKTSNSLIKGRLRPDRYANFASYLLQYVHAYQAEGIPIFALTVQNEPDFEPTNYPGMRIDAAARADFVANHLGPKLATSGLPTRILDWDHNWDQPQSPLAVLSNANAARYISGVAWHCYAGNVSAQALVHERFPEKDTYFTECSGGGWQKSWREALGWMTDNLVIGSTRAWAKGVILWNMALDETSGPHLGGCGNCRGVVTIHSKSGAVSRNVEYYVLGHASRFVRTGAVRIASDTGRSGLKSVAFRNADDGSIVLIVLNSGRKQQTFRAVQESLGVSYVLPAGAVATLTWNSVGIRSNGVK